MKRLLLMRHGNADNTNYDYKRALTSTGVKEVTNIASRMNQINIHPELIIASSSIRTLQTAEIINNNLINPSTIIPKEELYLCTTNYMEQLLYEISDNINILMIVAHNPGIAQFYTQLSNKITSYPTAGLVVLDFNIDTWDMFQSVRPSIYYQSFH